MFSHFFSLTSRPLFIPAAAIKRKFSNMMHLSRSRRGNSSITIRRRRWLSILTQNNRSRATLLSRVRETLPFRYNSLLKERERRYFKYFVKDFTSQYAERQFLTSKEQSMLRCYFLSMSLSRTGVQLSSFHSPRKFLKRQRTSEKSGEQEREGNKSLKNSIYTFLHVQCSLTRELKNRFPFQLPDNNVPRDSIEPFSLARFRRSGRSMSLRENRGKCLSWNTITRSAKKTRLSLSSIQNTSRSLRMSVDLISSRGARESLWSFNKFYVNLPPRDSRSNLFLLYYL